MQRKIFSSKKNAFAILRESDLFVEGSTFLLIKINQVLTIIFQDTDFVELLKNFHQTRVTN